MKTLIDKLISCEKLLRSVKENFWANKIHVLLIEAKENIDVYVVEKILLWYGGSGSLNDLIISEHNNHVLNGKNEQNINSELNQLRNEIYQEAFFLKRNFNNF